MDASRLTPQSFLNDQQEKTRRVREAQEAYQTIVRNAERSNGKIPPYDFLELIGKGAFGRVYKCRDRANGDLVAVKILDTDDQDYTARWEAQDDTIRDFKKEVSILQQLKDSGARNVNIIHDAFDIHSQLWIVSDYCTGGSVRTLMHPNRGPRLGGLSETFIIPIARELAVALKDMHDIGIIHRDIKCSNVYITENGEIQLGDFGIVGVVEDGISKRTTVVGTPHWLPKEIARPMFESDTGDTKVPYSTEVDIWSYGCTIYEMAVGAPPNWTKRGADIADSLEDAAPRLEGYSYSPDLRDFVAFCLTSDPRSRPTADAVLRHPFIANTNKRYPTSNLIGLIERYKIWEHGGGSRASLWIESLADPRTPSDETSDEGNEEAEDWNFSTSDSFDQAFGKRLSTMFTTQSPTLSDGQLMPQGISMAERVRREHFEKSVNRGEKSVMRIFDADTEYDLRAPAKDDSSITPSDLPLRNFTSDAPTRESMIEIDLDEADSRVNHGRIYLDQFADVSEELTVRGHHREPSGADIVNTPKERADKRDTMAWTFATAGPLQAPPEEPEASFSMQLPPAGQDGVLPVGFQPMITRTVTAPLGHTRKISYALEHPTPASASPARNSVTSLIDLDAGFDDVAKLIRPGTASSTNGSIMTDMTSGNPFDLEDDPEQNRRDRDRFSYHKQWQSEGSRLQRDGRKSTQMHARGNSLQSETSDGPLAISPLPVSFAETPTDEPIDIDLSQQYSTVMAHNLATPDQWNHHSRLEENAEPQVGQINTGMHYGNLDYDEVVPANTTDLASSTVPTRNMHMPHYEGPHPDAMLEEADPNLVEAEYQRLLNSMESGLKTLVDALLSSTPVTNGYSDNHSPSDFDSSAESVTEMTEDESSSTLDQTRRQRTHDLHSPQLPLFNFQ